MARTDATYTDGDPYANLLKRAAAAVGGDKVVKPSHYTRWAIEPITFIMRNKMEYWRGNIIKYVARAGAKTYDGMDEVQSEITDLRKAIRYAEMRINMLEGKESL